MGAIYLVRHGQASFGSSRYDRLSEIGRLQGSRLGHYWREKGLHIDRWVTGSLERQVDTAALALEAMGLATDVAQEPRFNEFDHVRLTAALLPRLAEHDALIQDYLAARVDRLAVFQRVFEKVVTAWTDQDWGGVVESWPDFSARVNAALDSVIESAESGTNVAIVTSGGPITAMLERLLSLSPAYAFQMNWSIANASITKIQFSQQGGRRSLGYFNQYHYLQQGADRTLVTLR
ncbi:MAG: histidine phosphatase family protein [Hahellaceae bacterium]|nr:histidine phosphatase family protein [Hahellaceae bacterium]